MFHVTYEIVSQESAEHGEAESRGYVMPGEWHHENETGDNCGLSLRDAVSLVGCLEDSGSWFTEIDSREDYATGDHERRSLHPPRTISAASYDRLKRLLRAR